MTRYSSDLYPIKVVVKAAVLQVCSLTLVQAQKLRDGHGKTCQSGESPPSLLWIMTPIAQQPLESPGTHSADVQTLISDPTMFPWNGNNIRKVWSGGFRSLLLSRWPLKCLARDVISFSKQGSQPRAKCILSFHQQLKWASVQQHSVPVFLRTPNPPSKLWLQREQAEPCSIYISTSRQILPLPYMH